MASPVTDPELIARLEAGYQQDLAQRSELGGRPPMAAAISPESAGPPLPNQVLDPALIRYLDSKLEEEGGIGTSFKLPQNSSEYLREKNREGAVAVRRPTESGGYSLPSMMENYLAGFNRAVAKTIGAPVEVANELLNMVGMGMWDPSDRKAQNEVLSAMRKAGIKVDAIDGLAKSIGEETFNNFVSLGVITKTFGSIGNALSQRGSKTLGPIMQDIHKQIVTNPKLALALEQGAAIGAEVGADVTGSELGRIPGAVVGAGVTNSLTKFGNKVGTRLGRMLPQRGPLASEAVNPDMPVDLAKQYAAEQITAAEIRLTKTLQEAVEDVQTTIPGLDPRQAQTVFRQRLDRAEQIGNRIESDFWSRVDQNRRVPMSGIKRDVEAIRDDLVDAPLSEVPDELLTRLYSAGRKVQDPETGRIRTELPTIKFLRGIARDARLMRKREESNIAGVNWSLVRNINRVERAINDGIAAQFPNDVSLTQARNVSMKYHDLFSRGPIADLMSQRPRGDMKVPAGESVDHLMGMGPDGLEAVNQINRVLNTIRAPGGRRFAVTSAERQEIQSLVTAAEDAIRANIRAQAENLDPAAAAKWVKSNEAAIKPLARVSAEGEYFVNKVRSTLDEQKIIERSSLARFAQMSPDIAIDRIFSNPNPVQQVNELLVSFRGDPDALKGLQSGMLNKLFTMGKNDPLRLEQMLKQPKIRDMFERVLDPSQHARMNRIINIASKIARGEEETILPKWSPFRGATIILSRVLGAAFGRTLAPGQLQSASIFAERFRRITESIFQSTDPTELMTNAILDPRWERLLMSRDPGNIKEFRRLNRVMAYTLSTTAGSASATFNALGDRNE